MARFNHRLAAGVGVFAAFFLLGTSATVAFAEPGGSHSDRGSSSDRGNGGGKGRGGSERHDHDRRGNNNSGQRGVSDERNSGTGDDGGSRKPDAGDDGIGSTDPGFIESPAARVGSGRVAAADTEESAPSLAAAPDATDSNASRVSESSTSVVVDAVSPGGSGSGFAGVPSTQFSPPQVTVGNGREPRTPQPAPPEPQWQAAPAPQPAPAAASASASRPLCTSAVVAAEPDVGAARSHAATGRRRRPFDRLVESAVGRRRPAADPGRRCRSRVPPGARRARGGKRTTRTCVGPCAGSCPTPTSGSRR